ncbi:MULTISPECIES: ATP-binding protein [unclassified Microbulbifer]|uniref:ATP-binding protein n=1 Tax=unclassified Microbulbifer TaxID=2619833 RepID=UPI0027E4DB45|nr:MULTISPECIES: ATP-binding protein [unclassified Microbulbifer]
MKGVIFIGLQASGKSFFYLEHFYRTHIRLNLDMLKTRHREKILFNACLESKQPVVIDNTNPTRDCRRRYISGFREHRFEVVGYYFAAGLEECLRRNALREGRERIPEVGIRATRNKLQLPGYEEGFDQLYRVFLKNGEFVVEAWEDMVDK